ncbi:MAG TPA: hypothetical protein VJ599_07670 [Nitrososphaeraceae archaeon]|nr:hypothetical protein [Nitrososphaeraceae archaeon]
MPTESYRYLDRHDIASYYKLHAISRASGILQNRKKSIKRGFKTKTPYLKNDMIISCYGFKVDWNYEVLKIPLEGKRYFDIKLNNFVLAAINIGKKGDVVFHHSKCLSGKAMVVESCLFPKVIHQVGERKFEAYVS